ncbi:tRNA(Ile)-lysidine synthetase, partial [candidate division TA06 bacterium]
MDLSIFEYLENDIVERDLISPGDKILAMVSGGRDSVFLLYFLEYLRKRGNIEVSVFHLNHMIRGKEAVRDEEFTGKLANQLGFPFYSKRVDVKKIAMDKRDNLESV